MSALTMFDFSGECRTSGDQLLYKNCPVCGSTRWKTYLNPETGEWFCHAGDHSAGGKVDVGTPVGQEFERIMRSIRGMAPPVEWPEVELPYWDSLSSPAREYLGLRGVPRSTQVALRLVETATFDDNRILIPYYDQNMRVIGWNTRRYLGPGDGPKYLGSKGHKPLYVPGHGLGSKTDRWLVLVEGPFDAIALHRAGFQAAALNGKHLGQREVPEIVSMLGSSGRAAVFLDPDAHEDTFKVMHALRERIGSVRGIFSYDHRDPGDMNPAEIRAMLADHGVAE